ncbi:uncharacterized protein LOC141638306 [Silene latifolia]|uniref:uncharacterized protein LOC141638306 n=1 Tax=Silene latifolia TaxID=37657 RepID=UPI003D78972A
MINLWSSKEPIIGKLHDAKEKTFTFKFQNEKDMSKRLDGQPWHFDKFIWCFSKPNMEGKMTDVLLHLVPLWARVYDLPLRGRTNVENARRLGAQLGTFISLDEAPHPEMERAIRLRIVHDVRKPLKSKVNIRLSSCKIEEFKVKYERLPTFCYGCGILGHGEKDCDEGPYEEGELRYDASLRASPWKVLKTIVEMKGEKAKSLSAVFEA